MQDELYNLLLSQDEITWQNIIYDLIKSEKMDPWDIDISLLTKKYIETVNKLKEMNFFISGKVLLASALLLRIKSTKLVSEDIASFDQFLYHNEEEIDLTEDPNYAVEMPYIKVPNLAIKTPQARRRKISVNDLMGALQKALEVEQRRTIRHMREKEYKHEIPEKKVDITTLIKEIYEKVLLFFRKKEKITFTKIVADGNKEERILTILSLLHLDNQEKINLEQEEHFGEIEITLPSS